MVVFALSVAILFFYAYCSVTQGSSHPLNDAVTKTTRAKVPVHDDQLPRNQLPTTEDFVRYFRYPFQKYNVTTVDGYILELHRIPHGIKNNGGVSSMPRIPVIFAHGLFQDSSAFVSSGENSPAFIFADAGYDVWMLNYRGNPYSCRHKTLVPEKDFEYWDFSYNEIGIYDIPAFIDRILSVSGHQQLFLVGFSLGGASVTVFLTENPKYYQYVVAVYLLAPAISMPPETHELVFHMRFFEKILFTVLEDIHAVPYSSKLNEACKAFCFGPLINVCRKSLEYALQVNTSAMESEVVISQLLDLTSQVTVKMMSHLMQMVVSERFAKYDYGDDNENIYNQTESPSYDIENITVPVTIFCGLQDGFINCSDMLTTCNRFRNLLKLVSVPFVRHFEFVFGDRAKHYVYDVILQDMLPIVHLESDISLEKERPQRPVSSATDIAGSNLVTIPVSEKSHGHSVFFAIAIAFLMAYGLVLLILHVKSRFQSKSAGEDVSLVAYRLRPVNYLGNS